MYLENPQANQRRNRVCNLGPIESVHRVSFSGCQFWSVLDESKECEWLKWLLWSLGLSSPASKRSYSGLLDYWIGFSGPLGYCLHDPKKGLLYGYMVNGSMISISMEAMTTSWIGDSCIQLQFLYLQEDFRNLIWYCDMKLHNVLQESYLTSWYKTPQFVADIGCFLGCLKDVLKNVMFTIMVCWLWK
jgi:hypothetical protein